MRIVAELLIVKGMQDDRYTLFDNGEILHEFDTYSGKSRKEKLNASNVNGRIKEKLLEAAKEENKAIVAALLGFLNT